MYSRFSNRSDTQDKPIQIPEHYSGCAFANERREREQTIKQKPPIPAFFEVGKPTPPTEREEPVQESVPPPPPPPPPPPSQENGEDAECHVSLPGEKKHSEPFSKLFGNIGSAFPFSHGLGFEELLILGLIIMLSKNEDESDMILLLGLLLFCG